MKLKLQITNWYSCIFFLLIILVNGAIAQSKNNASTSNPDDHVSPPLSLSLVVKYIFSISAVLGACGAIYDPSVGIGKEFLHGFECIGTLFLPIGSVMCAKPVLANGINALFGNIFEAFGGTASMASNFFIAVDMGGNQLSRQLAHDTNSYILATIIGYMAGCTISFTLPVGFVLIPRQDHFYFSVGIASGLLSVPIGYMVSVLILCLENPFVSSVPASNILDHQFNMSFGGSMLQILPVFLIVLLLWLTMILSLKVFVCMFRIFGRGLDAMIKILMALTILQYFTGVFSMLNVSWPFDPVIADSVDLNRALEISGMLGMLLSGVMPFIYLLQLYCHKYLEKMGSLIGLSSSNGNIGFIANTTNSVVMLKLFHRMSVHDKILNAAFAVCGSFVFGDHMAYASLFQPTMLVAVVAGKLIGGLSAMALAHIIVIPMVLSHNEIQPLAPKLDKYEGSLSPRSISLTCGIPSPVAVSAEDSQRIEDSTKSISKADFA